MTGSLQACAAFAAVSQECGSSRHFPLMVIEVRASSGPVSLAQFSSLAVPSQHFADEPEVTFPMKNSFLSSDFDRRALVWHPCAACLFNSSPTFLRCSSLRC